MVAPAANFWRGKRVLLTGHTGFKGAWLALWLNRLGAEVTGIALAPPTDPNLFDLLGAPGLLRDQRCDIRDPAALAREVRAARPEIVLHLAAQALVRAGYAAPLDTFATNVMGTANLLEALRGVDGLRAVVCVTTDKVYLNREWHYPYREDEALGGHDPYSASKAACELVIASYRDAYLAQQGVAVASARAGNVIGGGDWAADRLLPDAVRAWRQGQPLQVRNPGAVRPWQHVLEPLAGYLRLAQVLWEQPALAGAYNFGPHTADARPVRELVLAAQAAFGQGEIQFGTADAGPHEAGLLALEISKARSVLGVQPRWDLSEAVRRSMHWYRRQGAGESALALCQEDITAYEAAA